MQRKLTSILYMDVVGYTRLTERDEIGTVRRLKEIRRELFDPSIKRHSGRTIKLIGDGGERKTLQHLVEAGSLSNVRILDPVPRNELFKLYREADLLFLHLNDYKAFRKVLPSKIFEYAATDKPILAGVGGYAADFLRKQVPGVHVFEPCDVAAMRTGLQRLLNGPRRIDRTEFCSHYLRKNIMRKMAKDVLTLA